MLRFQHNVQCYWHETTKMKGQAFIQELAPPHPLDTSSQIHSLLLEDKVDYGIGYWYRSASLSSLKGRGTTTVYHCRLYPPVRDYELGLCML